jgi:hypothetical protein
MKRDDTISVLETEEEKEKLKEFNDKVLSSIEKKGIEIYELMKQIKQKYSDKKSFVQDYKNYDEYLKRLFYF